MQRRMNRKIVISIVLAAVLIVCILLIYMHNQIIEKQNERIQVLLADSVEASYTYQVASQGNNQVFGQEIVFWNQDLMERVSSPDLGNRSIWTEVVALCGKSSILFDSSMGLEYSDANCCLLSHSAAYELFGIKEVEKGTILIYQDQEFKIVGSIPSEKNLMVYEVSKDSDILFETVIIDNRAGKDPDYLLEQFGAHFGAYMQIEEQSMLQNSLLTDK